MATSTRNQVRQLRPASEAQLDYISSLVSQVEHTWTDQQREITRKTLAEGLNQRQASAWIERLLELKRELPPPPQTNEWPDVPEGRYAITGQDGSTDFYQVDRPTQGRWAGYVFVKLYLGGGGEQRIPKDHQLAVAKQIMDDGPQNASMRFGRELGICGVCGATLTNDESRALGIGPVCRANRGW